jgi:hypothetical protein
MVNKQGRDAIHAPVEDVKVPFSLKLLVIFMTLCLLALIVVLAIAAGRSGMFVPLI